MGTDYNANGGDDFYLWGGGAGDARLYVNSSGNVGIGTISPATELHVDGGICVTSDDACGAVPADGEISAETVLNTGADYAEYFYSEGILEPGDIVTLDTKTGKVRRYKSGDSLLGIVSTQPGVVGNSSLMKAENTVLVALVGQVPFNIDQVKINKGLITTVDNKIIGQALFDGKVYINISSVDGEQSRRLASVETKQADLKLENKNLKTRLKQVEEKNHMLLQRLESIEKRLQEDRK